ncbi:hypothetical protein [Bradyrhizobium sp. 930_D9_N1_4]|uniref:hypothetical protein n=1 Tax=Bradyrhizobium sp. 930_D9_N1_4 TaxID=3240374 RepID=UPI003F8B0BC3
MMKSVFAASAVLVALCSTANAHEAMKHSYMASPAAMQVSEAHPSSYAFAAPTDEAGMDAHQYHGGPKMND